MHVIDSPVTSPRTRAVATRALVDDFDAAVDAVARAVDTAGSACLPDVVTGEWLRGAREFASTVDLGSTRELFIEDIASDADNFAHQLVTDHRLVAFLESLASAGLSRLGTGDHAIESELRLVKGSARRDTPLWFHYDSTAITMVVPILIPSSTPGESGELVMCPNRRPYRHSVLTNIAEKLVSQNDLYRRRFTRKLHRSSDVAMVPLEPGNAYVFSGYRSYHATMPCPPGSLRVTLILHIGDVHQNSRLLAVTRRFCRSLRHLTRLAGGATQAVKLEANGHATAPPPELLTAS